MAHEKLDASVPEVDQFEIVAEDVCSADAIRLISELSGELACRYNFADDGSGHFRPEDVVVLRSVFLIGRLNGRAVACGAVRPLEDDVGEVKRMCVEPATRGRGLAKRVLAALEMWPATWDTSLCVWKPPTVNQRPFGCTSRLSIIGESRSARMLAVSVASASRNG